MIIIGVKMLRTYIFIALLLFSIPPNPDFHAGRSVLNSDAHYKILIKVDPRIELICIVQTFTAWNEVGIVRNSSYKQRVVEYFSKYSDHEAITLYEELLEKGFSFDEPINFMLHLTEPPELRIRIPFDEHLIERAGGNRELLMKFVHALRKFVKDTEFMKFIELNREFYRKIEERSRRDINVSRIAYILRDFFGFLKHKNVIILAPLIHVTVGYGAYMSVNGTTEMYAVMGPTSLVPEERWRGKLVEYLALHEFIHAYVNPLTDKYFEENPESRSEMEPLMDPIFEKMRAMAYGALETTINEHIVRAIMCLVKECHYGMSATIELERQERAGFIYIKRIYKLVEEYYAKRKKVSFNEYHQKIMSLLKRSAEEVRAEKELRRSIDLVIVLELINSIIMLVVLIVAIMTLLLLRRMGKLQTIKVGE